MGVRISWFIVDEKLSDCIANCFFSYFFKHSNFCLIFFVESLT